jgi:hypothetical protein
VVQSVHIVGLFYYIHIQFGNNFKLSCSQTFDTSGFRMRAKVIALYYSGDAVCDEDYKNMPRYDDYITK